MKTALITGSNGFVGRHLTRALEKENIKVIPFSRSLDKQLTRPEDFASLPPVDMVFHLGAISGYKDCNDNTNLAYEVNVGGTVNVLDYCRRVKAKLIFPSTYVYDAPYETYKTEADPAKPMTHYSFTKWLGEKLCRFYGRVFGVNTLILRTANVYGPGQSGIYLIPILASHLKANKTLYLTKPDIERSFIYIDDLIKAYIKISQMPTRSGDVYNVSFDQATPIADVLKTVTKVTGKKIKVIYSGQGRPHEISLNRLNNSKIKKTINWKPEIYLEEGLKKLQRSQNF
jgi:nucleoside-diphosphate-sugar epimerase